LTRVFFEPTQWVFLIWNEKIEKFGTFWGKFPDPEVADPIPPGMGQKISTWTYNDCVVNIFPLEWLFAYSQLQLILDIDHHLSPPLELFNELYVEPADSWSVEGCTLSPHHDKTMLSQTSWAITYMVELSIHIQCLCPHFTKYAHQSFTLFLIEAAQSLSVLFLCDFSISCSTCVSLEILRSAAVK